jgi:hypothetical protein
VQACYEQEQFGQKVTIHQYLRIHACAYTVGVQTRAIQHTLQGCVRCKVHPRSPAHTENHEWVAALFQAFSGVTAACFEPY